MDIIATAQAVKYAREWVISGKGRCSSSSSLPLRWSFVRLSYQFHQVTSLTLMHFRMSDPARPTRTREEVQRMRSRRTHRGLQR